MFGAICASRPVQTNLQVLSPTQFIFHLPTYPSFSHIVVFLLPGQNLPPGTAAGVYIRFPPSILRRRRKQEQQAQGGSIGHTGVGSTTTTATGAAAQNDSNSEEEEGFKFLGAIANEKPSAIFRVRLGEETRSGLNGGGGDGGGLGGGGSFDDDDAMVDEGDSVTQSRGTNQGVTGSASVETGKTDENMIILGISIEPVQNISAQVEVLKQSKPSTMTMTTSTSMALVPVNAPGQTQPFSITDGQRELRMARKIITHAFNFLASFAVNVPIPSSSSSSTNSSGMSGQFGQHAGFGGPGPGGGGGGVMEEVVPLRAFRDWWNKFEKKIELDPSFLTRDE
ncbi:MAG: Golgi apyrase [Watsoniomyces obsoletus]|nr:MAG: Golgi apyrase [Watsoniomyces obsoletus]